MKLLITIFVFTLYLIGTPIVIVDDGNLSSCKKYNKLNKYDYLTQLVQSSNFDFNKWLVKPKDTNILIDEDKGTSIIVQLYIKNEIMDTGLSGIGWLEYNLKNKKLFNITLKLEELDFDSSWSDVLTRELFSIKKFILISGKTFLYSEDNKAKKTNTFLIKGDCALVLNENKVGWIKIYFYNAKRKTHTIMWVNSKEMKK